MRTPTPRANPHLLLALAIGLAYHGSLLFYTFKRTYDAYVHIFFADHYARAWFDHWEYRWYTGFTMTSYPPGSHQSIALLSRAIGLQNGFIVVQTAAILLTIIGVYRFSRIWVSEEASGYAALVAVFSSSLTETMHVFGQLPTTFSLGFLLNALPFVWAWLRDGRLRNLLLAWAVNAATTAGHHVTTLFGAVFFVAPVIALALAQDLLRPLPDEDTPNPTVVTRRNWRPLLFRYIRRLAPGVQRAAIYGGGLIVILVMVVLPYWLWSRADPITQVPIPHASRDSFIENTAAGLVFWLIPWGLALPLLPYIFYKGLTTRAWPMTLSLGAMFVLGTGGTTPIPRLLLRGAFDILTLDRFTFWATILALPLTGEFVHSLRHGRFGRFLTDQFGRPAPGLAQAALVLGFIGTSIFTANMTQFRRFQPEPIDMQPIVNFIEKDQHWRWRYLTLGFGDQVAWLSAQTTATTVDGNYHSARRLPELTTTPVERLEGAKFRGIPGIGSLQQFLAVPEKYNLKFVFSNDAFYDPLLYFSGWHQIGRLENGIVVWEREDIPPLPEVLPRREIPLYQRFMWGIVPPTALTLGVCALLTALTGWQPRRLGRFGRWLVTPLRALSQRVDLWLAQRGRLPAEPAPPPPRWWAWLTQIQDFELPRPAPRVTKWMRAIALSAVAVALSALWLSGHQRQQQSPESVIVSYYDDLDFRRFDAAYNRLDPATRPTYELYRLQLSVDGGLLASYAKLDAITVNRTATSRDRVDIQADLVWITALERYTTTADHTLIRRDGRWTIAPAAADVVQPPDQFLRDGVVSFRVQERRRVTDNTTSFSDVQDRPELEIVSARLVEAHGRLSVVGAVRNVDVDPADVTVTAVLYGADDEILTTYNAQMIMVHKLLPLEETPFRIDFEGVAGAVLVDDPAAGDFAPDAFAPVDLAEPVARFDVFAKAVVTSRDLYRGLGVQAIDVSADQLAFDVINSGNVEALIPHVLVTYYAADGEIAWVDHDYLPAGVRPQRERAATLSLASAAEVELILRRPLDTLSWTAPSADLIQLPATSGFAHARLTVHGFMVEDG